jgi:uncharacterized lipoprotein YehR (DUF1307 family)
MRKVSRQLVSVLLGLSIAMVVAACGDATQSQGQGAGTAPASAAASTAAQATVAPVGGAKIKVTVPEGWQAVEKSVVPAQYMKGTTSFIAKTESFAVADLDGIIKQALAAFERSFSNVTVQGKPEPITVDSKEGRKLVFSCDVSGLKMKYMYVYVRVGGQIWALTFGGMADSFDALDADYQAILSGIKFE